MFIKQAVYLHFLTVFSLLRHLCLNHTVFFFLATIVFFLNFTAWLLGARCLLLWLVSNSCNNDWILFVKVQDWPA